MRYQSFLLAIVLFLSMGVTGVHGSDGSGMQTSVAGDIVGSFGSTDRGADNRLDMREAEFMFYGPLDPTFDAMAAFAAHYESGVMLAEAHGVYIETTKLVPRSSIRIGQFFLGFGRLNNVHRHDWPFITVPLVNSSFFDREGALDTGVEYGYLLPIPFYLNLTAGVTSGWNFGHSHSQGSRPRVPTHYLRLANFVNLPGKGGLQTAFNYVGRTPVNGLTSSFIGLDIVTKWRTNQIIDLLIQSEAWMKFEGGNTSLGLYVYPQHHLGANFYLGARFDYLSILNLKDGLGLPRKNFQMAVVPTVTWQPSEFARFRLAYTWQGNFQDTTYLSTESHLQFQTTFILGAHPAHDF